MLKVLKGLFSYRKKSVPTVPVEHSGVIINNKISSISDYSQNILIDIEKDYSFSILFMTFSLLKNLVPINNIMLLICCKEEYYQAKIKYILSLLSMNAYTFIDDYNFFKEDLINIYLNETVIPTNEKLIYYNINNAFKTDLALDLFDLYKKYIKFVNLNLDALQNSTKKFIKNINDTTIFNLNDDYIVEPFTIRNIVKKYLYDESITIFTKNEKEYREIFLDHNTTYIDINTIANQSVFHDVELLKFMLFLFAKDIVSNQDYILILLTSYISKLLNKEFKYKFLYNAYDINPTYLSIAKQLQLKCEPESQNTILNKPLVIGYFTRVTRIDNLQKIYQNIQELSETNFANYKWFLILPNDKNINSTVKEQFKGDNNIIFIENFISFYNDDKYDSYLLNIALTHKETLLCQFIYVLDDDNLIHPNLINIIRKHLDKYIIINRIELSEEQKYNKHILAFESPSDLYSNGCLGKVDFSNCIFNTNALKSVNGFQLSSGSAFSDGATVVAFIKSGIDLTYSNELGAYYNKLQKENN